MIAAEPALIAYQSDAPSGDWRPESPAALGLDVEVLLVASGAEAGYRPSISIARRADDGRPLDDLAQSAFVECGENAVLLHRDGATDEVAQLIEFTPADAPEQLALAEVLLRWRSPVEQLLDTVVILRLICLASHRDRELTDFGRFVQSVRPDFG